MARKRLARSFSRGPRKRKGPPSGSGPCAAYLAHLKRRNYSPQTCKTYAAMLDVFKNWCDRTGLEDLCHATATDLQTFQVWLSSEHTHCGNPISKGACGNYVKVLRGLYRFLHEERMILANPAEALRYPKKRKRIHRDVLTAEELRRLLSRPDVDTPQGQRDLGALRLLAFSGLRISELCGLTLGDVDLKARELTIKGKGRKERIGFFDHETRQVLARYLVQSRPVLLATNTQALIVGDKGRRMAQRQVGEILARYARAARIHKHLTPHSFRRTFATLLLSAGCNLKVIAELMGHEQLSTTADYQKLDIAELASIYRQTHPLCEE